jgi:hypothetical protein
LVHEAAGILVIVDRAACRERGGQHEKCRQHGSFHRHGLGLFAKIRVSKRRKA